jgi:WD40 repeat protein
VLLSLIIGITVTLAGWRNSDSLNLKLTQSLAQRDEAIGQAQREKNRASDAYAELAGRTAILSDERGDVSEAALWFTHAARQWTTATDQNSHEDGFRAAAWLAASPRPIAAFRHAGMAPYRVNLSDDGNYLLLADSSRGHVIWDVVRDQQVSLPLSGAGPVAISPDGARIAEVSADGTINVYSLMDPTQVENVSAEGPVTAITFSPDSRLLAIASNEIQVWRSNTKEFLKATDRLGSRVKYIAFDSKSKMVLAHDMHARISVWGIEDDGLKRNPALGNVSHVMSTASHGESPIDPMINSYCVIVRSRNNTLEAYSLANGQLIWQYAARWPISSVSLSPDGNSVVLTWKEAQIWRIGGRSPERTVVGHQDTILATALSGGGEVLVTGGLDCETSIWRWSGQKMLRTRIQHLGHVTNVSIAGKKPNLIATAQRDGLVRVWKTAFPRPAQTISVTGKPPVKVIVSKDRRYAMAGGSIHWERSLKETQVFDAVTGETAGPPLGPGGIINGCVFSPDGRYVVTLSSLPENAHLTSYQNVRWAEKPGLVTVWDWRTGTKKGEAWFTPSEPVDAEYLPNGEELAVVCAGGEILLMDRETGKVRREMRHGNQAILMWSAPKRRIVVSPTGERMATLGLGQTVKVWNPNDGRMMCSGVHNDWIKDAKFSQDGRWLATASMDNTARVWDCDTGKEVAQLRHTDWVIGVTFDKVGDRIMTACRDHTARIWNWKTGSGELVLRHQDEVIDAAFASEGQIIVTTTFDGHACFWSRRTGKLLTPPAKGSHNLHSLAITGDGSSIIASSGEYGSPAFNIFHLPDTAIKERSLPEKELERLAVLFSGRRLRDATTVRLTTEEWMQSWESIDSHTITGVAGPEPPDEKQLLFAHQEVRNVLALYETALVSLKDKEFDKAYADFALAKELVEKSVKSRPAAGEYYNLACLNSLLAQTESERGGSEESVSQWKQASVDAFQTAIKLGYANLEHANADSDLNFVRQMPAFAEVLKNAPAHKE